MEETHPARLNQPSSQTLLLLLYRHASNLSVSLTARISISVLHLRKTRGSGRMSHQSLPADRSSRKLQALVSPLHSRRDPRQSIAPFRRERSRSRARLRNTHAHRPSTRARPVRWQSNVTWLLKPNRCSLATLLQSLSMHKSQIVSRPKLAQDSNIKLARQRARHSLSKSTTTRDRLHPRQAK